MAKKSTKLQALQDIFEENGISAEMIERNDSMEFFAFKTTWRIS